MLLMVVGDAVSSFLSTCTACAGFCAFSYGFSLLIHRLVRRSFSEDGSLGDGDCGQLNTHYAIRITNDAIRFTCLIYRPFYVYSRSIFPAGR
jgi:hypothetical protein